MGTICMEINRHCLVKIVKYENKVDFFIFLLFKHNEKVSRIILNPQYIKLSISYGLLVHSLKTFINKT